MPRDIRLIRRSTRYAYLLRSTSNGTTIHP